MQATRRSGSKGSVMCRDPLGCHCWQFKIPGPAILTAGDQENFNYCLVLPPELRHLPLATPPL